MKKIFTAWNGNSSTMDSIKIIRKQIEKYEELVEEQAEKIERAKHENGAVKRLKEEVKTVESQKKQR
jgi:hypothetical protein